MTPIFKASQIKAIDAFTIKNRPISSINLMELAVREFCNSFPFFAYNPLHFVVVAGPGNNGGDALGIARHLIEFNQSVKVYLYKCGHRLSEDCETNKVRLEQLNSNCLTIVDECFVLPEVCENSIIIDGLFGNGLNRPLDGDYAKVVEFINGLPNEVVAIDIPSGLMAEDNGTNIQQHIVRANKTYTFQYPKLAFFFAENEPFVGQWSVLDIGLMESGDIATNIFYVNEDDVRQKLKKRSKFAHKGSQGHSLIIAGQPGMAGAALLATKACLRSGVGKVTVAIQEQNRVIIQLGIPEAILWMEDHGWDMNETALSRYQGIGIGPAIGTSEKAVNILKQILKNSLKPIVIDADAINILATDDDLTHTIPPMSILTPHKLELKRLIGPTKNDYDELITAMDYAKEHEVILVVKGAYTKTILPDGSVYINSSGNPGMATAGSGDVLTGIITALLTQGYSPQDAAVMGVYLHGKAGDFAAEKVGQTSLIASDIINCLPQAFNNIDDSLLF